LADPRGPAATERRRVLILADDLIWADRLAGSVTAAGGTPVAVRGNGRFDAELATAPGAAIVDLTARAYDGIDAVRRSTAVGVPTLAVGQHDDHELRKEALSAGADRVLAYRKLADDGPEAIAALLARATSSRPG